MKFLFTSWSSTCHDPWLFPHKLSSFIVEIMLLIAISEFTSHQISSGNNSCPTCYGRSPLFPKLPPQLIKLSLLGLGYLKLLDQVTKNSVTPPAPGPSLQHQRVVCVSVVHMLLQQWLHHNIKKVCVCFPMFFKNKIGSWWGSQSDISTETTKRWWQAEILKYYKLILLWNT